MGCGESGLRYSPISLLLSPRLDPRLDIGWPPPQRARRIAHGDVTDQLIHPLVSHTENTGHLGRFEQRFKRHRAFLHGAALSRDCLSHLLASVTVADLRGSIVPLLTKPRR